MPHGNHMSQTAFDMAKEKMCAYPSLKDAIPHWKCDLHCCVQCPWIDLHIPE